MKGSSHALVGLTFGALAAVTAWETKTLFNVPVEPICLLLTSAAGGLKADADMTNNSQRKGYGFLWNLAEKTPIVRKLFGHRGYATHSYYLPVAVFAVGYALVSGDVNMVTSIVASLIIGLSIGMFSHVFIDVFNGKGAPVLFPVPYKIHLMSITSDTVEEQIFIPIFLLLMVVHIFLVATGGVL